MKKLESLISHARAAIANYLEEQQGVYVRAVEEAKQARLENNPGFPHVSGCLRERGLSVMPNIRLPRDSVVDLFTNAKCDDCGIVGEVIG